MANTATSFEEQITTLALVPWKAKQIIQQEFQGKSLCNLNLSEPLISLESNLIDYADPLRFSLKIEANTNTMCYFSPVILKESPRNYLQDFEEGLTGINKRTEGPISELSKEKLAAIRSSTLLRKLSQSPLDPNSDPSILLSRMQTMVAGLEDEQAARLLSNIGTLFLRMDNGAHPEKSSNQSSPTILHHKLQPMQQNGSFFMTAVQKPEEGTN